MQQHLFNALTLRPLLHRKFGERPRIQDFGNRLQMHHAHASPQRHSSPANMPQAHGPMESCQAPLAGRPPVGSREMRAAPGGASWCRRYSAAQLVVAECDHPTPPAHQRVMLQAQRIAHGPLGARAAYNPTPAAPMLHHVTTRLRSPKDLERSCHVAG